MICKIFAVLITLLVNSQDGVTWDNLKSSVSEYFREVLLSAVQNKVICPLTEADEHTSKEFGILHTFQGYSLWAMKEEQTAKIFRERLLIIKSNIQLIKEYLVDYQRLDWNKQSTFKRIKNLQSVGRPSNSSTVSCHLIIKRCNSALGKLRNFMKSNHYNESRRTLNTTVFYPLQNSIVSNESDFNNSHKNATWIGPDDKLISMLTFHQVQECYLFEPENISKGIEIDTLSGGGFNSLHSAEIGVFALKRRRYNMAVEWLENAIKKISGEAHARKQHSKISRNLLTSLLWIAFQDHNRMKIGIQNETEPDYDVEMTLYMTPITAHQPPYKRISYRNYLVHYNSTEDEVEAAFIDLCHGNTLQTYDLRKRLKCFYEKQRHPYLYINPVKVEQLAESPPIFQFYEMLGNETIMKIVEKMQPMVKPSEVVGENETESVLNYRSSAGKVMKIEDAPNKVHLLSEMVSGLRISINSEFQYVEYSYGRFYTYHEDTFREEDLVQESLQKYGNRLATILYYMELPVLGGYTPFLNAGIYARPVRGSAVLWLNMYRNGSLRDDVKHGACPVLHGHKIVMNHWIRANDNFNHWKCSLNQYE